MACFLRRAWAMRALTFPQARPSMRIQRIPHLASHWNQHARIFPERGGKSPWGVPCKTIDACPRAHGKLLKERRRALLGRRVPLGETELLVEAGIEGHRAPALRLPRLQRLHGAPLPVPAHPLFGLDGAAAHPVLVQSQALHLPPRLGPPRRDSAVHGRRGHRCRGPELPGPLRLRLEGHREGHRAQ